MESQVNNKLVFEQIYQWCLSIWDTFMPLPFPKQSQTMCFKIRGNNNRKPLLGQPKGGHGPLTEMVS